ncbi:imidazoleglycerol-phosphate dehydratase [Bacillus licheniformis]|nr:imidazoleglycerol-phosphate dehydratase [Bacillus licheniformis]
MTHMLDLFTKHGQFDLSIEAKGDVEIDDHHTTEDIGICLGQALLEALGDKQGIKRYGSSMVPMDEALAQVAIDLSNRPHLEFRAEFPSRKSEHLIQSLSMNFVEVCTGSANESACHRSLRYEHTPYDRGHFKALGRALDEAALIDPRVKGIPSTKGML